ncbi:phospholipid carrier-dependent glycosyltransferase [Spirochaetia bacterium 38H-sp]|uniref:Polyprenol-phosphate-mannose--protein mannosyltransferase n=1 Tax=Rarispira pelagica TaxID=3141764 RepID=A0ABU9UBS7_9SPIR
MRKGVLLLVFLLLGGVFLSAEEVIKNPGFEEWNKDIPTAWALHTWKNIKGVVFERSDVSHSGKFSVYLENMVEEDSKVFQTVRVKPGALYRFSAWVKAEGVPREMLGANLSAMESMEHSMDVKDTGGRWQQIVVYARAGKNQDSVRLTLRLGGYGALSRGKVWFDDVSFVQVKAVPEGAQVIKLYREENIASVKHGFPLGKIVFVFLIYVFLAYFLYKRRNILTSRTGTKRYVAIMLGAAFLLRLLVAVSYPGHVTDMPTFYGWATELADKGIFSFYGSNTFKDYPPGYLYILYVAGLLIRLTGAAYGSWLSILLLKLPSMLIDLLSAFIIIRRFKDSRGLALATLYVFNPAVIYNSSLYGQVDSILGLLIMLVVLSYWDRRYVVSAMWLGIMLAIKPQAMLFAPIGLFFAVKVLVPVIKALFLKLINKDKGKIDFTQAIILTKALFACTGAYVILHVPFFIMYPAKFSELYMRIMSSYPFVSVNAANFWALMGYNWKTVLFKFFGIPFFVWQKVIQLVLLFSAAFVYFAEERGSLSDKIAYSGCKEKTRKTEDKLGEAETDTNKKESNIELSSVSTQVDKKPLYADKKVSENKSARKNTHNNKERNNTDNANDVYKSSPVITALFLAVLGFTFLMRMHERYLYPAIILSICAFLTTSRKGFLVLFFSLSFSNFINLAQVIYLAKTQSFVIEPDAALFLSSIICVISALGLILMLFPRITGAISTFISGIYKKLSTAHNKNNDASVAEDFLSRLKKEKTDKKTILMLTIITAVYSVVALINLGSASTPTTIYKPQVRDTYFVIEKKETKDTEGIAWYRGYGSGSYIVYTSQDRKNWKQVNKIENTNIWAEFGWQLLDLTQGKSDKYLLIRTEKPGQAIHEIILYNSDFKAIAVSMPESFRSPADEGIPENLIDEQTSWNGNIGFYTNMYFDEIYHARTAYEYAKGIRPLETTHPPLGKLIMSLGILIFKMTPFGWRIPGTLIGILMLPLIFLLAKELFKRNDLALITTALIATESLHFVQTRIATIDSYAVFFIILMYIPMVKYYLADNKEAGQFKKYAIPLMMSGIFFGLGAASKWTCIYAGGALAFLYFTKLGMAIYKKDITIQQAIINMLWAFVCFIALPAIIYSISYIPFAISEGVKNAPDLIKLIIREQKGMYVYHSQVKDPHPFASPWWQWPLMIKPMWYYSGQKYLPQGYISSILAVGNPFTFWIGSLSMLALIFFAKKDKTASLILILFAFQYLPWAISPRTVTFIYHFFTSTPFIILALAYILGFLANKFPHRKKLIFITAITISTILFAAFYPILSGAVISKNYASLLRWFNTWYFYQ